MEFSKYTLKKLRSDDELILYRGHRQSEDHTPVLVLTPASPRPTTESLHKLEHEFSLRGELEGVSAARALALSNHNGQTALVLEDPGGEPLNCLIEGPMEIGQFLKLAAGTAAALGQLHKRGLIHKDLKPANLLVNAATWQVFLTGFGIASRLLRERQAPEPPEFIAGTLPYMAPEQTGRMNRSIDSRSDLYALGVVLYEMLTGVLPFQASDPMEWVHCHIARQPIPPADRLEGVPRPVSAIVMKLLAKTAEDRYQTATGAEIDLRRCLADWEEHGKVSEFPPGERDTPDLLLIPEKLFGRTDEIDTLLSSFDRVVARGKPELVLVSGYSGIGKSSVVNELHKVLVPPRGIFASGKFDQYKRDIPYATLAQAFQSLIRPLLGKSEDELGKWRDDLSDALAPHGKLMIDLVPELRFILGEQPEVPDLPPQDAKARFQRVFRRFIGVFARPEHPLALFLDDLQWLDAATLDLIEHLLAEPDVRHLMLIGAYRDNEVSPAHPLMLKLEAIRLTGATVHEILLAPLARRDLTQLVADSLHCEPSRAMPLAGLIHEKTAGNPFFAIQFLSALVEEGLVSFDHDARWWHWDFERIRAKRFTDNVVDLMLGKLNRLPIITQQVLQELACLGNAADLSTLSLVRRTPDEEIHSALWEALRLELVIRSEDSYKFAHDRVQEAAYSLISEDARTAAHLRLGRLLAAHIPPTRQDEAIFEIVNQYNRGAALVTSRDERERLAELNLSAGKRARASTAYASGLKYLRIGAGLLTEDCWERRHDLIFPIEFSRAECEFLTGDPTAAAGRLAMLATRAANTVELATVTCLRVDVHTTLDRSDLAIAVCLDYLRHLGVEWSPHPTFEEARREYDRIWSQLGDREIGQLIDMPLMTDPPSLATLAVLTKAMPPALFTDENLSALVICGAVNLSLERGNSDGSCGAYVWFGVIAGPRFGNYKAGFEFGQLGYQLVEQRGLKSFQAPVYMLFGNLVMPWTKHIRAGQDLVRRAFDAACKLGDLTFAGYSCNNLITNLLAAGDPLPEVQREAEKGLDFAHRARFGLIIDIINSQLGLIRTLRGLKPEFGSFDDEQFNEQRFESHLARHPALAIAECWYWVRKLQARFFCADYTTAIDALRHAERLLWTSPSLFEGAEAHFYGALSHAACSDTAPPERAREHFESLVAHHRLIETWAANCPANFENRAALVGAEIARIEGRILDAERLYEEAIRSSQEGGFVQNEAVANELASRFYATRGFEKIAHTYLRDARYCYSRWGATGKVRQLDELHPHLQDAASSPGPVSTIGTPVEQLDLTTVIKVSQALSGEIVLGRLIDTLMRAAIEHAGAERGLLILLGGTEQRIQAEATTSGDTIIVRLVEASVRSAALPESLVNYAMRTQQSVILHDALTDNSYSADPYISQHRARSILCLPLMKQSKLIGALYLENNLTPHVFTPNRIALLKLLASQAAISIENTSLYRDLEEREAKIRRLVDANIMGMFMWNLEGEIFEANEAFLRMVGHGREDLTAGRLRWTDLTPPEWREGDAKAVEELKATGTVRPLEKEFFSRDGIRVPVLFGAALFEAGGSEGVAFVLDLSEQKRVALALQATERDLSAMVNTLPTLAWSTLPDGFCDFLNQRWLDFTGLTSEQARGVGWATAIHPDDAKALVEYWQSALASGQHVDVEARMRRFDGEYRWFLFLANPLRDESGQIVRWYGTNIDIEDRKQADAALRANERNLNLIINTIPALAWSARADGSAEFFNQHYLNYAGLSADNARGWGWTAAVHSDDLSGLASVWQAILASGQPGEAEARLRRFDGEYRWFLFRVNPLRDEAGTIVKWYGINSDIEDRKRAEEALRSTETRLSRATRSATVGEFAAAIAHEVNQPLAAVVANGHACLRWLSAEPPGLAKAHEAAERIVRDGKEAGEIVRRIRALFREAALEKTALDINEVIREVLRLPSIETLIRRVAVEMDLCKMPPLVMGDRVQLQQLIFNLLLNGIEAMDATPHRPQKLLLRSRQESPKTMLVEIRDWGVGMKDPERVFEAFFSTKENGMGMGLAVCRSIIHAHDGRLWAESNEGEGTTFCFTLPVRPRAMAPGSQASPTESTLT